jgi:hypothetical protein
MGIQSKDPALDRVREGRIAVRTHRVLWRTDATCGRRDGGTVKVLVEVTSPTARIRVILGNPPAPVGVGIVEMDEA